jgi:hypothetical protein
VTPPPPAPAPGCSLVLAAEQPAALAAFYGGLLQQPPATGFSPSHWRLPLPGGGQLELYAPSRDRPQPRQVGRLALCLQRSGPPALLAAWIAEAEALGGQLLEGPRQEPFGAEAWLADPEGNRLLLLMRPAPAPPSPSP